MEAKQKLFEKKLESSVGEFSMLGDIKEYCSYVSYYQEDTLRFDTLTAKSMSIDSDAKN